MAMEVVMKLNQQDLRVIVAGLVAVASYSKDDNASHGPAIARDALMVADFILEAAQAPSSNPPPSHL